jgi:hypothetical protein
MAMSVEASAENEADVAGLKRTARTAWASSKRS